MVMGLYAFLILPSTIIRTKFASESALKSDGTFYLTPGNVQGSITAASVV